MSLAIASTVSNMNEFMVKQWLTWPSAFITLLLLSAHRISQLCVCVFPGLALPSGLSLGFYYVQHESTERVWPERRGAAVHPCSSLRLLSFTQSAVDGLPGGGACLGEGACITTEVIQYRWVSPPPPPAGVKGRLWAQKLDRSLATFHLRVEQRTLHQSAVKPQEEFSPHLVTVPGRSQNIPCLYSQRDIGSWPLTSQRSQWIHV